MQFVDVFLFQCGCESRLRVFRASLIKCEQTERPAVGSTLEGKLERRLAVVIPIGSLVTLVGILILSHLAVRKTDLPPCKVNGAFVVYETP